MLFIWRGSVIPKILPRLGLLLIVAVLVALFRETLYHYNMHLNPTPFTLFGIALALFLGFRNSASYERWWEGRKAWGAILNTTRSLARQSYTMVDGAADRTLFINYLIAFTHSLKHQLRQTDPGDDLDRLLPADTAARIRSAQFKPAILLKEMGGWIQTVRTRGVLDSPRATNLDSNLNILSDMLGTCERIASTPIPYSYSVLLHRTVYVYCFLLPFGLIENLGWMMPIIVVFIAYTYVALEAIADELEDPFGLLPNDLALDAISRTIENTLLELDGRPLNPTPEQENYFLT